MKKLFVIAALLSATLPLFAQPLDDIAVRSVVGAKPILTHAQPNERDIFWQKRIWRVLDVRENDEFAAGHLPKARHIPLKELEARLPELAKFKEKPVIVTCRSGARSGSACRALRKAGFTQVHNLKGGVPAWQQANLPVEK